MSQTAARTTPGTLVSAFIRTRQRPPVPRQPIFSVSLATPRLLAGAATATVEARINVRREMSCWEDMEASFRDGEASRLDSTASHCSKRKKSLTRAGLGQD